MTAGRTWQSFKNDLPTVSVHDIRMQQQFDDLVIATHGRSTYIMDDMTPIQQLQTAVARGNYLFPVRVSYQYNLRQDDEGIYTNYARNESAQQRRSSTTIKARNKRRRPTLEIVDASDKVIRTYKGTHEVNKKQEPWVPNKVGLNRFVWNWTIDGPVKWYGAAKTSYQGPDDGPSVPPGVYIARLTLGNTSFTQRLVVKADPRTLYTQAQMVESYDYARRGEAMYSQVDTMLDNLDTVKKAIVEGIAAAKKAGDSATQSKLEAIDTQRMSLFDELTANYQNDEDGIERPGKVREDVQTVMFFSGAYITPAMREYGTRVAAELRQASTHYNAFVRDQLPALNGALKAVNVKAVTIQ